MGSASRKIVGSASPYHEPAPQEDFLGFGDETAAELEQSRLAPQSLHQDHYVEEWVNQRLSTPRLQIKPIPLTALTSWHVDPDTGNICHASGMFFTVTGIKAKHRSPYGDIEWDQPMIDQPEIGILGILVKRINGILHFCLQAKEEPGNINSVQLSPTVQATYSNYTKAHGGKLPPLVDYFLNPPSGQVLFAKLQTEDGGRFLFKSNRNMIVRVAQGELDQLPENFIWLTLRQIARLLKRDNLIHACTRSVLASIVPASIRGPRSREGIGSLSAAIQWLDNAKAANHIMVKREGLKTLKEWRLDSTGAFSHREGRFFQVIGIEVRSTGREVSSWGQPILANPARGVIGLLTQKRDGQRHYLMQAKAEAGNRSMIQLGPTVQFTPSNYAGNEKLPKPFLFDEFANGNRFPVVWQNYQAEEGARFFQEAHLHRVQELPDDYVLALPPGFYWMSEAQICFFLHLGENINSCARSIISCLL